MGRLRFFKVFDLFILLLLTGFPVYSFMSQPRVIPDNPVAVVEISGQTRYRFLLSKTETISLNDFSHPVVLKIEPGKIRILKSDCPKQICVRTGFIDRPGQTIACVPHKLLIHIVEGNSDSSSSKIQAVTG